MPKKPDDSVSPSDSSASSVDLKKTVKASVDSAPQPNDAAINAHAAREAAENANQDPPKSEKGKPGPKPGQRKSKLVRPQDAPEVKAANYRKMGEQCADLLITAGITLGGEDWKTKVVKDEAGNIVYDEQSNLRQAWGDLAEEYKWEKMPAYIGVVIATGAYMAPRFNAPSTISRFEKLKLWLKARKIRKQEEAKEREAREAKAAEV